MPANVETMFSAVETPWHRLGVVTKGALSSTEAIEKAGLDWTVSLRPVYTGGVDAGGEEHAIEIADTFATVRDSDDSVLGVVGNRYTPVQNQECFSFLDTVLPDFDAKYETAGSLDGGRIVWVLLNLGKDVVVGQDKTIPYLLMTISHDGSMGIKALTTPIRVVCQNTLTFALNNFATQFSFRHTQRVHDRIEQGRNSLELSYKYIDGFQEEVERLIDQQVSNDKYQEIIDSLFPVPELKDDESNVVVNTKARETQGILWNNFENPEFDEHKGTAWSVVNAISNYELWSAPIRNGERDVRIMQKTITQTQTPKTNLAHRQLLASRY
jgi:phage/plasmid-like protein (TIGR03299 family)